jgi:hypothetical protein
LTACGVGDAVMDGPVTQAEIASPSIEVATSKLDKIRRLNNI